MRKPRKPLKGIAAKILKAIEVSKTGLTVDGIEVALADKVVSGSIRPALRELEGMGLVERSGRLAEVRSGRRGEIYVIPDKRLS